MTFKALATRTAPFVERPNKCVEQMRMILLFTVKAIVSKVIVVLFEFGFFVLRNLRRTKKTQEVTWKPSTTKHARNFPEFILRFQLPFSGYDKLFFLKEFSVELFAEIAKLVFDNKSVFINRVTN